MENLIPPMIFTLLAGGVAGYFAGNIAKRASARALTIGVFAFILDINFDAITTNISNVLGIIGPLGLTALLSSVPFVASFVAGLFIGYRRY
jgi:hypothetical protein